MTISDLPLGTHVTLSTGQTGRVGARCGPTNEVMVRDADERVIMRAVQRGQSSWWPVEEVRNVKQEAKEVAQ